MAGRTDLRDRGRQELCLVGAMGAMAPGAVAALHGLMGIAPFKRRFGIRMAAIANRIHSLFEHPREIGAMGIVAGTAAPFGERCMNILALQPFFGLGVAREAELRFCCAEQPTVLGRMGPVAGEAALSLYCRCMGDIPGPPLIAMALKAELVTLFNQQLSIICRMGRVADQAFAVLEGAMLMFPAGDEGGDVMTWGAEFHPALNGGKRLRSRGSLVTHVTAGLGNGSMDRGFQQFGLD